MGGQGVVPLATTMVEPSQNLVLHSLHLAGISWPGLGRVQTRTFFTPYGQQMRGTLATSILWINATLPPLSLVLISTYRKNQSPRTVTVRIPPYKVFW